MFFKTFWAVILASTLACLVTTVGIYVINKHEKWGNKNIAYFISFAAGVLISVSFIHIIPKSISMNQGAPIYLLAGFMGMYLINRFINTMVCHEHNCENLSIGVIPTFTKSNNRIWEFFYPSQLGLWCMLVQHICYLQLRKNRKNIQFYLCWRVF